MRRLALSAALLALLAHDAAAAAAPSQERARIAPVGSPTFPERSYRLAVPARRGLAAEDVVVTENGGRVAKLSLASAEAARAGEFGSILVIDASASMHGRAIREAIAAARVLAGQRTGSQQIGIIAFNRNPRVVLAPTDDQAAIDAALSATPALAPQTRIFDAVNAALDLLDDANISAGSIVVLSDGSDTGSLISADPVAQRARKANVTIHTVGLRSRAFNSRELQDLAVAGRGRYSAAASVSDLRGIFRVLGAQLASDYLVRYRSAARPGREVTVAIRVTGVEGIALSTYRAPGGASYVQVKDSFWTSGLGAVLTGLLFAVLVALALWILLARRGRGPTVRERVRGFVSMPGDESPARDTVLTGRASSNAERSLEKTQWWTAFRDDVEIARIEATPMRIVTSTVLATLVCMFLLVTISGLALVGAFALAIPWGVRAWVRVKRDRQRALFTDQLPDVLQGSASAIRAGHGLVAALSMVAEDAPQPSRNELRRVVSDEALGVPLDEALRVVQHRMDSRDVMQIALVAQIQRESGGNIAEVLDRITETLRQSAELRRMVKALTAQGRLSRWVVTALPLVLLLVISLLNPAYIRPLFTETLGLIMLAVACGMMFVGSLVIGKIVNFTV